MTLHKTRQTITPTGKKWKIFNRAMITALNSAKPTKHGKSTSLGLSYPSYNQWLISARCHATCWLFSLSFFVCEWAFATAILIKSRYLGEEMSRINRLFLMILLLAPSQKNAIRLKIRQESKRISS